MAVITFASDAVMDMIEAIERKPEAERTDEERWRLHYAKAHGFTRRPRAPEAEGGETIWSIE